MSVAELFREFASALDAFGPEATEADTGPAVEAVVVRAAPETLKEALSVLVGSLDRLRRHPTPAQGAADLRRLADEIDPLVEVEIVAIPDGCYCLGDPPPVGPPLNAEGTAYLA